MKTICSLLLAAACSIGSVFAQTYGWSALNSGTTVNLPGISAVNESMCYVAGSGGTILKTVNGGTTWAPQVSGTAQDLSVVRFIDELHGFAAGNNASFVRTTDGGTTWTPMNVSAPSNISFRVIYFIDNLTGFLCGQVANPGQAIGYVYKTTDGGTTWTYLPINSSSSIVFYGMAFTSPQIGHAIDYYGNVYKTTNGGTSWTSMNFGIAGMNGDITFPESSTGITSGSNGAVYRTTNAGTSWTAVTDNISSQLAYSGTSFCNATNGFMVGGNTVSNSGIILQTTDGGATWTTFDPGSSRLMKVNFVDISTGYAVGLNGTILKYGRMEGLSEYTKTARLSNYPNPFSNCTTVDFGSYVFAAQPSVVIYDVSGKQVRSTGFAPGQSVTLEKEALQAGSYTYRLLDGTQWIGSGKMIVE